MAATTALLPLLSIFAESPEEPIFAESPEEPIFAE